MLSYNTPVPINGQPTSSNTIPSMSTSRNSLGPKSSVPVASDNTIAKVNGHPSPKYHHIWLVTGPAGCGKTTVAKHISSRLNVPYVEGDDFHPKANIEKMANGVPLTDADRWDWLTALREESLRQLSAGAEGVVLTCSALKRKYRDVIRVAPYFSHNVLLHFIYLHAPEAVLMDRVGKRKGHYMGANMVHSQFSILEPPTAEETDVISVDVSGSPDEVLRETMEKVTKKMAEAADD